jgi:hypothetical protein
MTPTVGIHKSLTGTWMKHTHTHTHMSDNDLFLRNNNYPTGPSFAVQLTRFQLF